MKAMADRVFRDVSGGMAVGLAWIGTETGLFRTLSEQGPVTLDTLAAASGLVPRYVEEWSNGMVAAGYLDYEPETGMYALSPEHAFLLASDGTDHFMGGLFGMLPSLMAVAPQVLKAFREGGGVPFEDFPPECRHAIDMMNRGNYEHRLVGYWLQQLPDTVAKLEAGGRALDLGCGRGQAVAALAKAFPLSRIIGVDPDTESINEAQATIVDAGLSANTEFVADTLDKVAIDPRCDLITACDCLHDMPEPAAVLRDVHARLADDGVFMVIEPRVADRVEDNINPLGAMFYGISVFHCMTQSLAQDGAGLGACMGPARTTQLLSEAGFSRVDQIDIRSPVNLFYAARR